MDESLGKWRPIETSATDEANSWKGSSYSGEIKPSADRGWVKQEKAETLRLRNELAEMRRMNAALIHSGLAVGTEAAVLRTHNELLESDLTALRERMRWRDVLVELPLDLLPRIVVDDAGYVFPSRVVLPYGAGKWMDFDGETVTTRITHWMDLPAAPEVQNG